MNIRSVTNKIRIRASIYNLIQENIYRTYMILLGKNKELGTIDPELMKQLSTLLATLRDTKAAIEKNTLFNEDHSPRSRELKAAVTMIEELAERGILTINR